MSTYLGDLFSGCTLYYMFTTVTTTGAPTQLAGTPALSVYKMSGAAPATQSTAGITLSVDCDTVTGMNGLDVRTNVDTSFYSCGHEFAIVITTGTVGGTSVVGYVVGTFSLNNRSGLRPTIHGRTVDVTSCNAMVTGGYSRGQEPLQATSCGRTLDVTATGAAGVDWGNVENPGTAQALACTTTFSVHSLDNSIVGVSGNVTGSVASVTGAVGSVTGAVGSVTGAVGSVTGAVGSVTGDVGGNVVGSVASVTAAVTAGTVSDKTGYTLSAAGIDAILDEPITEPAGVFAWASATLRNIVGWLGAVSSNKLAQDAALQGLCNRAVSSTIASAPVADDGTAATRGSFTTGGPA